MVLIRISNASEGRTIDFHGLIIRWEDDVAYRLGLLSFELSLKNEVLLWMRAAGPKMKRF